MSYITTFITITLFYTFYYSVKYFDKVKYKSREFYNFIIILSNSILCSYKIVLYNYIEYSISYLSNFFWLFKDSFLGKINNYYK